MFNLKQSNQPLKPALDSFTQPLIFSPRSFYTVNEVHKFQYSRPVRKGEKDPDNEFAVIVFALFVLFCFFKRDG